MEVKLQVYRYDSDNDEKAYLQEYTVDLPEETTVLQALSHVRDTQDGSIAFRGNCHRGFCGDCTLKVNGRSTYACIQTLGQAGAKGEVKVEPIKYVQVLKDLVSDTEKFLWRKQKMNAPGIVAGANGTDGFSDQELQQVRVAMRCTVCGLCDEGCTVIDIDQEFMGPAGLTKAYRYAFDPRDSITAQRLKDIGEPKGLWDCVHCFEATEHCPKEIATTDKIFELRDKAVAMGIKSGDRNKRMARHYDSFAKSIKNSGWLNEARLTLESEGILGMGKWIPMGLKALPRGKAPLLHHKRPDSQAIRKIFEKWEAKQKEKG